MAESERQIQNTVDEDDEKTPLIGNRVTPDVQVPAVAFASNITPIANGGVRVVTSNSHHCSSPTTLMHLMKGSIGTGLLSLPIAVKRVGYVLGPVSLILMAVVCISCMYQLVQTSKRLCRRLGVPCLDYAEVAENAFNHGGVSFLHGRGATGSYMVNFFLMTTQLGFCCVYFIFMADNIRRIYVFYYGEEIVPDLRLFILMLYIPVMLLCFIQNLDDLSPFSTLANVFTVFGIVIIYYYLIYILVNNEQPQGDDKPLPIADNLLLGYPFFFGSAIYAYEGIGVILPLENKMKKPEHFGPVLLVSMILVSTLYTSIGFLGYFALGENIQDTITYNLPQTLFYQCVKLAFVAAIFVTYNLQLYVPAYIIWPVVEKRIAARYCAVGQYLYRASLVMFTMILALSIPQLANFISLVGAFSSSSLAMILPPILDEITRYPDDYSKSPMVYFRVAKNIFFVTMGVAGMVVGTFVAIWNIVGDFQKP